MDARSAELLEFPQLQARLAARTRPSSPRDGWPGPSSPGDPIVVRRRLDETDEARWLLSVRPDMGIGGARDIVPVVARAARAGRLDPTELWAVVETLIAAGRLADGLRELDRPLLHALYRSIDPLPALRSRLEASVDATGESRWTPPPRPWAGCGGPSASPTSGCAVALRHSSIPSWPVPSRSPSSRCATVAT